MDLPGVPAKAESFQVRHLTTYHAPEKQLFTEPFEMAAADYLLTIILVPWVGLMAV